MSVGDSGHGVDLEVLVRADLGHGFDGSPVGEAGLGIVEPLVAKMLHVVSVQVSNSLGNFGSGNTSVKGQDLLTNFLVNF